LDVSTVIVNWNTCGILRDCLASLYANTANITFKVIVVDNASSDGSVDMIKSEFPQVELIVNAENRGFAAANNQAIAVGKGRYVLLLNSDTVVLDGALDKIVAFADSHPEAGIVTCRALNKDRTLQPTCFMFPSVLNMFLWAICLARLFPTSRFFGRERMTWWDRNDVREVDVATGCFMLVRREAMDQIGLLDERFFMYGEETDWCYRFRKAGWKILFTPDAEIIHLGGASTGQVRMEMALEYVASISLFFKKHTSRLSYRLACLLLALCFSLRALYWLAKGIFSKNTRSANIQKAKNYTIGAFKGLLGVRT
jgi:GT2 family glycosyltransferase